MWGFWTLAGSLLAVLPARFAPNLVAPLVASLILLAPVLSYALTDSVHATSVAPVLGALLASVIVAAPGPARMPRWWRETLTLWALVVAIAWPAVALREIDFSWPVLWDYRVPTAAGGFPPPIVVLWIAHVAASQLIGLLWMDYLWTVHGRNPRMRNQAVMPLAAAAFLGALLAVYQGYVDLEFLSTSVWPYHRRAAGALVDANGSGMLTAMWMTGFIAIAASSLSRTGRATAIVGAVASAFATWCSGSRSAFAAAAVGAVVTLVGSLAVIPVRRRVLATAMAAVATIALALTLLTGLLRPQSASPLARILASVPARPLEVARWLWTRDGYGSAAVHVIRESPVVGVGIGTFHSIGVDYSKTFGGVALPPDNAQNWYRHQIAELGIVGSLGWLAFLGVFVTAIVRRRPALEDRLSASALCGALAGLAVASLVGVPAQHPAIILTFWTFVFWLARLITGTETTLKGRATSILIVAIVIIHATGTVYSSRHDLRVPFRAARFDFDYGYGFTREEGSPHVWVQEHAVIVPPAPAPSGVEGVTRSLQLTLWSVQASEEHPVGTEISLDGRRVVRRTLRGSQRVVELLPIQGDRKRFVLDVHVRPPSGSRAETRLALQWEFVK